jgi:hypothetical protein
MPGQVTEEVDHVIPGRHGDRIEEPRGMSSAKKFYKRTGKRWICGDYVTDELQNALSKIKRLT